MVPLWPNLKIIITMKKLNKSSEIKKIIILLMLYVNYLQLPQGLQCHWDQKVVTVHRVQKVYP